MPERTFRGHKDFKEWYHAVERFRNVMHTIKAMKIDANKNTATVKIILRWERSDDAAPNPVARAASYSAQTWTLERAPENRQLRIITYDVDYFLEECPKGKTN